MLGKLYIQNQWVMGEGDSFASFNPATHEIVWQGEEASFDQIQQAVTAAKSAFQNWANCSFEERVDYLKQFQAVLEADSKAITEAISKEVGKPLWEAGTEVAAMCRKLSISIEAYQERCKEQSYKSANSLKLRHKPHGVVAVFGPFNFPAHLPNGHIIPALLAGNTVVFKPSDHTPLVAERVLQCWQKANLPAGVINLVQGGVKVGRWLSEHPLLDGLFFTGSYEVGQKLSKLWSEHPEKILALEMGGNNPLIVHEVNAVDAAVYHSLQSAYVTTGQRCTSARRLIVTRNSKGERFVEKFIEAIQKMKVGAYTQVPEPFMGPLISEKAAQHVFAEYENFIQRGAKILQPMQKLKMGRAFLSPGLLDVTSVLKRPDTEIFGPLLQLIWVDSFDEALKEANETEYGLAAGLLCEEEEKYYKFLHTIKAGILSWNSSTTGASSNAPFGGIGKSGNHRPSAYYAADYCAYPVVSQEMKSLQLPDILMPGIQSF